MRQVSKEQFAEALAAQAVRSEPETERDGEYLYEIWCALDGREVGSVTYRGGEAVGWMLAD